MVFERHHIFIVCSPFSQDGVGGIAGFSFSSGMRKRQPKVERGLKFQNDRRMEGSSVCCGN